MNLKNYKIIFFGTPEFAKIILKELASNNFNIVAVVCQPDKPAGRKLELKKPETKILAQENNIPVLQPEKIEPVFIKQIKSLKPDLLITAAYGLILPKDLLEIPKYGAINVHASLLPKYRGASPIAYAILNNEKEAGITLIKMTEELDAGPIIVQKSLKIERNDTTGSLHDKLAVLGSKLLSDTLFNYFEGNIALKNQNEKIASYAPKLTKQDGHINWDQPAEKIFNFIRAMYPWPGAWSSLNKTRIKITKAQINESKSNNKDIGKINIDNSELTVLCKIGSIDILELQMEGKNLQNAKQFINGHKNINNSSLK